MLKKIENFWTVVRFGNRKSRLEREYNRIIANDNKERAKKQKEAAERKRFETVLIKIATNSKLMDIIRLTGEKYDWQGKTFPGVEICTGSLNDRSAILAIDVHEIQVNIVIRTEDGKVLTWHVEATYIPPFLSASEGREKITEYLVPELLGKMDAHLLDHLF